MRFECKKAFAEPDCSSKLAKLVLRKSAPVPGDYTVGYIVCFRRDNTGARTPEETWSTPTRIIGFDGPPCSLGIERDSTSMSRNRQN